MGGLFLVLEGGDGAGKSSQLALLKGFLQNTGRSVESVHFPRLEAEPYGRLIAEFLRGELGPLEVVHPKLAALLYALDRCQYAPVITRCLDGGGVFLADRYLLSNVAYQCAKVSDPGRRGALANWIASLEYGTYGIPRPTLTLYLDAPARFTRTTLQVGREGKDRDYLRGAPDIHEESDDLQTRVRREFLRLAEERPDEIEVIDCREATGDMADKETIHRRIVDVLERRGFLYHHCTGNRPGGPEHP